MGGGESMIFTHTGPSCTQTTVVVRDVASRGEVFAAGSAADSAAGVFLVAMCRMTA
jgi:hypothetical protein